MLAGDKFMHELHLRQPGVKVLVDHLLSIVKWFKSSKKQCDLNYIYENESDKVVLLMMLCMLIVKV